MKKLFFWLLLAAITVPSAALAQLPRSNDFHSKYKLKEVVVFSRHGVRSPLTDEHSALAGMTPHKWNQWSAAPSHLTLKGGVLETIAGQFFGQWVASEGLLSVTATPTPQEVLFYANSRQRTIATARYFASGFLPISSVPVTWKYKFETIDPVFDMRHEGKITPAFQQTFDKEMAETYGADGVQRISQSLKPSYDLIAKVLDLKDSEAYKSGKFSGFNDYNLQVTLRDGNEAAINGNLKAAAPISDALLLQYYEESDSIAAGFGHKLTRDEWRAIARPQDVNNNIRFSVPCVYLPEASRQLAVIEAELKNDGRKFAFLCGHDNNIICLLHALGVKEYDVPNAIEAHTPVGSKLVFEKWVDASGKQYIAVNHVYQTIDQIRNAQQLSLSHPPMVISLNLQELNANADGLYSYDDFIKLLNAVQTRARAYDALSN